MFASSETEIDRYDKLLGETDMIEIVDSSELTMEMLQNRNGKIIIEKCIGIVTDDDGNGKVMNANNPDYDYIGYKGVENIDFGDVILTYFIYNPDTNYVDDILYRFDFIIDK